MTSQVEERSDEWVQFYQQLVPYIRNIRELLLVLLLMVMMMIMILWAHMVSVMCLLSLWEEWVKTLGKWSLCLGSLPTWDNVRVGEMFLFWRKQWKNGAIVYKIMINWVFFPSSVNRQWTKKKEEKLLYTNIYIERRVGRFIYLPLFGGISRSIKREWNRSTDFHRPKPVHTERLYC